MDELDRRSQAHDKAAKELNELKVKVRGARARYLLAKAKRKLELHAKRVPDIILAATVEDDFSRPPLDAILREYTLALGDKDIKEVEVQRLRDNYWDFKEDMRRGI